MLRNFGSAIIGILMIIALPAQAEMRAVTQVYGQIVTYTLPSGFVPAFENEQDGSYIQEAVPSGESLNNWTQLITLTGIRGGTKLTPLEFARQIFIGYEQACPDSLGATNLPLPTIAGARDVYAGHVYCGTVNGQMYSEQMLIFVLIGEQDVYTLQWAQRGPPSDRTIPFDATQWTDRYNLLSGQLALCLPVPGEAAPYPSCPGT